jgi:hypothetical protein
MVDPDSDFMDRRIPPLASRQESLEHAAGGE